MTARTVRVITSASMCLTTLLVANACLPPAGEQDLSSLDAQVLTAAIDDFKTTDRCASVADYPIRIDSQTLTADILTSDVQVKHETKGEDWSFVSVMLENLQQRNAVRQPLVWQPRSSLGAVVMDLSTLQSEYDFLESFPDTRCHMRVWLPGYSHDRQHSLVRFWWGPTSHGATATYLLDRDDQNWRVRWRHIAYYAQQLPNKRMQLTSHRMAPPEPGRILAADAAAHRPSVAAVPRS